MIEHCDTEKGEHYWAIFRADDTLLVVIKTSRGYDVCGPYQHGVSEDEIDIIQKIEKPKRHKWRRLLYGY